MVQSSDATRASAIKTDHLLAGMLFGILIVFAATGWVAFSSVRSLDSVSSEARVWSNVDANLIAISDDVGDLFSDAQNRTRRQISIDFEAELLRFQTVTNISELRHDFDVTGRETDDVSSSLDRLESSSLALIDAADEIGGLGQTGAEGDVDRALSRMSNTQAAFRLNQTNVHQLAADARGSNLTEATDASEQQLDRMIYGTAPVLLLLLAATLFARQIQRREDTLAEDLRSERQRAQAIVDCLPVGVGWKDPEHRFLGANLRAREYFASIGSGNPEGKSLSELAHDDAEGATWQAIDELEQDAMNEGQPRTGEFRVLRGYDPRTLRYSSAPLIEHDEVIGVVTSVEDVTEARELERALVTSSRMESIGQLAAGVAHEINTPIQFVSDNTAFLNDSFGDLLGTVDQLVAMCRRADDPALEQVLADSDVDFLREEVPQALEQSTEGLGRVSEIVKAMKSFSHPGTETTPTDLNEMIEATVSISRSEWKYVADVALELEEGLPLVSCREGELKQVVLNMVVNAAHAIGEARGDEGDRQGQIVVSTSTASSGVEIKISDNGAGMTPEIRDRIFDQFFTTKQVGRGTGQGLALAWDIVKAHEGRIDVESIPGEGTTFVVSLPLEPTAALAPA